MEYVDAFGMQTWIICKKPNGNPTTRWNSNRIPLHRINQIEFPRVTIRVEIPGPFTNNKEIKAM